MSESPTPPPRPSVLGRGSYPEALRIGEILRKETVGGILLVAAAVIALIWANSPVSESYFALRDFTFGYEPWHLELSLGAWAADGLLAIFFFLVGLELKREFVAGDLRDISKSIVPVAAAVGGVIVLPSSTPSSTSPARRPCVAGPFPPPRTSPLRWLSLPLLAPTCPVPCEFSC